MRDCLYRGKMDDETTTSHIILRQHFKQGKTLEPSKNLLTLILDGVLDRENLEFSTQSQLKRVVSKLYHFIPDDSKYGILEFKELEAETGHAVAVEFKFDFESKRDKLELEIHDSSYFTRKKPQNIGRLGNMVAYFPEKKWTLTCLTVVRDIISDAQVFRAHSDKLAKFQQTQKAQTETQLKELENKLKKEKERLEEQQQEMIDAALRKKQENNERARRVKERTKQKLRRETKPPENPQQSPKTPEQTNKRRTTPRTWTLPTKENTVQKISEQIIQELKSPKETSHETVDKQFRRQSLDILIQSLDSPAPKQGEEEEGKLVLTQNGEYCWLFSNAYLGKLCKKSGKQLLRCQNLLAKLYDFLSRDISSLTEEEWNILNENAFSEDVVTPGDKFEGGYAWKVVKNLELFYSNDELRKRQ